MWKMINEQDAIEAMAISFRFAESASILLSKRILQKVDRPAFELGLTDKQPIQGFQVNMANPGEVKPITGGAMLYQKTSLVRMADGSVEKRVTAQVECQPAHLTYQTWKYDDWKIQLETVKTLLLEALKTASQGVALGAVRTEYLDRFYFDGDPAEANVRGILREPSTWIAPHVFGAEDLWHSHAGKFEEKSEAGRRLLMVHADYQDLTAPVPTLLGKRSLQLMTAVEQQYVDFGMEISSDELENFLSSTLDDLHSRAINLFRQVVNSDFASENGLPV
jgi:hypothetical protein